MGPQQTLGIHHITLVTGDARRALGFYGAFRAADDEEQGTWRERLVSRGRRTGGITRRVTEAPHLA